PPVPQLTPAPSDVEVHPFPIPPQPAVQVQAQGVVTAIPGGIRLTFAPGSADLNPETHQAILTFGQNLAYKPHVRALINAYSSGAADDPSLPRRMSLARGLAARSVLMNGGIPSTRIYVRVIGVPKDAKPGVPEDHIDIYQSDAEP
ncbi:MAG: OmpA family protein, partial [Acetobacter syzygii]